MSDSKEISSVRSTQFYEDGGAFFFVNNVEEKLPPGTYRVQYRGGVQCFVPENLLTDQIFRLEHSIQDTIIDDIKKFWTKKEVYEKFGLLHKRGILMHGPQGSGKSSVIYQLCDEV